MESRGNVFIDNFLGKVGIDLKNFKYHLLKSDLSLRFFSLLILFFIITIFFSQGIQADIISINAGGGDEIVITPDTYIEGFFTGDVVVAAPVCGNSIIETGEQCDDGNTDSGDGCSSTCQTEVVAPPTGEGAAAPAVNIAVDPERFNIRMAISSSQQETIKVTNLGTSTVTVSVSQQNLDKNVILGATNLTLVSGETQDLSVVFVSLTQTGIFTGKILIGGKQVLVTLNIRSELLLFDSNIVVLNENFQVPQGDDLRTLVTLIPLGDPERLDVTLDFVIKDYNNNIYLTKSETLLVNERVELRRDFDTGTLPLGDYIVGLELKYPNGVAPSSAHFEVIQPTGLFARLVLFMIFMILVVSIFILIILIWRRRKKKKEEQAQQAQGGIAISPA